MRPPPDPCDCHLTWRDKVLIALIGFTWALIFWTLLGIFARWVRGLVRLIVSFDHDLTIDDTLGMPRGEITGYDLAKWMFDQGYRPKERPRVHSMNPVGAKRIRDLIADRW